jgi:diaminobutyrate-2-oxoglutarate transaminase
VCGPCARGRRETPTRLAPPGFCTTHLVQSAFGRLVCGRREGRRAVAESALRGCGPVGGGVSGAGGGHYGYPRRRSARESAARVHARALPVVPVRARGLTAEGADGCRSFHCLSGAGTPALGHNHPVVLEAIRGVLDSGAPLQALAVVAELFRTLPFELVGHVRVRAATGRTGILAVEHLQVRRPECFPLRSGTARGLGGSYGAQLATRWTGSVLGDPRSGVLPAPDAGMRHLRRTTVGHSGPLEGHRTPTPQARSASCGTSKTNACRNHRTRSHSTPAPKHLPRNRLEPHIHP